MSVRKDVEAILQEDWALIPELENVRVIATERELDEPTKPTALIRSRRIARSPEVPNAAREVGLLLTLISAKQDPDAAQDELDELVEAALDYLKTHMRHGDAETVGYLSRMAFDIPLTVLATKE